jgi:hypothetical protein
VLGLVRLPVKTETNYGDVCWRLPGEGIGFFFIFCFIAWDSLMKTLDPKFLGRTLVTLYVPFSVLRSALTKLIMGEVV